MSYRPPKRSQLVAPVSQRVAVVLAAWLPDDQVFRRTATMEPELRLEVLNTIDSIKAAALMHRQSFAEVGNRPTAITPEPESLEVDGECNDPAGPPALLHSEAAAGLLGISSRRVRQLCEDHLLEAEKINTQWIITRESINQYLALRKAA